MIRVFYAEPEGDRWLPFDRYPRRLVRRLVRGRPSPGGMQRYYLNLLDGLERCGHSVAANDYRGARGNPREVVGVIGKGHLLRTVRWANPVVFGPAVPSHPLSDLSVFQVAPVRKILVSCDWLQKMYQGSLDVPVAVWAAGVDTYTWAPSEEIAKDIDVLVYDKIRWERARMEATLRDPILQELDRRGLRHCTIRYGEYREAEYQRTLARSKAMIFLVEHETQGFAYLQALASGVPLLAWDEGGLWRDPEFYPHRVQFDGVTSVPYWDDRCGVKFAGIAEFAAALDRLLGGLESGLFRPREYVLEHLGLEKCALNYVGHLGSIA